ncbi:MAG: peptidoglycan DD-metalloendopeptidase family protein [Cyanobacteria bacterium]|nr:peptidoglycan DD-metalloendopeptidase family protein [Cyanobacteriota bacterium]
MTSPKLPSQSLSKIEFPSTHISIVLWSHRVSLSLLSALGLGLAELGLLAVPIAQAQTTGTDIKLLEPSGLAAVQAPSPIESIRPTTAPSIAPPEVSEAEVEPMPTVTSVKPKSKAPEAIIFSDRTSGCHTTVAWGAAVPDLCKSKPTDAVAAPHPTKSVAAPESVATKASDLKPEPEAESSAAHWGRISVDRQGIQFSPPDVLKPYFNGNLKLPKMPSLSSLGIMFPLAIPSPITSLFGWRIHPIFGDQRMHTGTDIAAPLGTPVIAALTGKVLLADFLGGYGIAVALEHGQGSQQTLYAHLSELFVKPGQVVEKGTVIGRVGTTGNSTGPHLHFELRQQLPDGSWIAQDAGLQIEVALKDFSQSLKVAKLPQTPSISLQAQLQQVPQPQQIAQATTLPLKAQSTIVKYPR